MLRVLYILVYVLLNLYVLWRSVHFLKCCSNSRICKIIRVLAIVAYVCIFSSLIIAHFTQHVKMLQWIQPIAMYYLGIFFYSFIFILLADIIRFIAKKTKKLPWDFFGRKKVLCIGGSIVALCIILICTYGSIHYSKTVTNYYATNVNKEFEHDSMRIVLVADFHLGYCVGADMIEEMVRQINEAQPDLVCIAGDIFDNNFESLDDPERIMTALKSIESTYGVYGCWGNHDIAESLFGGFTVENRNTSYRDQRMDDFMEQSNVQMLTDETICVNDEFYIIGRKDYKKAGDGTDNRMDLGQLMANVDTEKPVIVLEHQPRFLQDVADGGADLHLCGHTHDGQIFPLNFSSKIMWDNSCGKKVFGDMTSFVTSGVGIYGTNLRVLTDSEVMVIDVTFKK